MSIRVATTKRLQKKVQSQFKKQSKKVKSQMASAMNKETRAIRKEIVESLMAKTKLKRKIFNDRLSITRANPNADLITRITPIFGKRIFMMDYPWARAIARGGKQVIALLSPIYRKNLRTGFISKDGSRMYIRFDRKRENGKTLSRVRAVRGRSVPRLWDEFAIKAKYTKELKRRVLLALRGVLGKKG